MDKEPPDKYSCIKLPIHKIIRNENYDSTLTIINDAVMRTNYIIYKTYLLLRLWILQKYHKNENIPFITESTIKMCMKSLVKESAGPKPKGENLKIFQEFKSLHNFKIEDGKNLSAVLDYYAVTILTAIENNIKLHFIDYINRFVNSYFKFMYKENIENKDFKKNLFSELKTVKNDIINNTLTCNYKYHSWLNENRYKIVPENYDVSYFYDIKVNPQKYLKNMIFMNIELEKIEGKMFQFFPLQTKIIQCHIQIDTKSLIELLIKEDKKQYFDNVELNKEFLWDRFFDIKIDPKKYNFDYTIITDGYSVSLRFINKKYQETENVKKEKMRNGKKALKGLTLEEKEKIKNLKKTEKTKNKKKLEAKEKKEKTEFPYIDEVLKDELNGKHIFIDPGKRALFTIMDDDENFMIYSNKQRIKETKRLKYHNLLKNYRDKRGITEIENELSSYNSKTCNIDKFNEYITNKIRINEQLYKKYQDEKFRKYKFYSYINKKRAEDNMLNKIEKKYSKDHIIIIGDWSIGKQMRNFISTPNLSLKRKLQERFKVYNIDEYRTSCLNHKTEELCNNLYLPDKNNKIRKMHSILTYQMENKRLGCINRDRNGCKNIKKVFNFFIENNDRPEKYKRSYQIERIC